MTAERPLVEWARRVQTSCAGSPQRLREQLESTLRPMIGCALRTGLGQPPLVAWVREQLPLYGQTCPDDPSALAGPMARALSERLIARLDPASRRETVVGP